ncbi:cache domain-containing protein [Pelagibacterium montanilacus]|uniref:cache domain-containing protein n=1 Tax=Pelagibacterium montanilacus TaxID=2185280 RepID=UPI000F8D48B9|nr:cache domain-containing protein [Pelagibacterium montanilacus]
MSLRALVLSLTTLILLIAFAGVGAYFLQGISQYTQSTSVRAVEARGQAVAQYFAGTLHSEWQRVQEFAEAVDLEQDPEVLQAAVDGFGRTGGHLSWAGLVGADGAVIAATDALLVDANVSQRPWFQRGLEGPFAGDVHEAVLLADLLQPGGGDTLRFIDFSAPIRRADGSVAGVFGVHIDWNWVQQVLTTGSETLGLETVLTNTQSEILLSTLEGAEVVDLADVPAVRSAALGRSGTFVGPWPGGQEYFSFVIPEVTFDDLPRFGWAIVARLDSSFIVDAQNEFQRTMLIGGGLALIGALLALTLLSSLLFRPLARLVDAVSRFSKGEDVGYVDEQRPYREAAQLSNAIARLQSGPKQP